MAFSLLEDKGQCIGVFEGGLLSFGGSVPTEGLTWAYNRHLRGRPDVKYAKVVAPFSTIALCLPKAMAAELENMTKRYKAHLRSLQIAQVDFAEQCTYDYIPEWFLLDYYRLRNEAIDYIWKEHGHRYDPDLHAHVARTWEVAADIADRTLKFDQIALQVAASKNARFAKDVLAGRKMRIKYDPFRAITGRFATNEWSFPIHNLKEEYRKVILPKNGQFLELDYNAADARVLLSLSGQEQPMGDIHTWNIANVFNEPNMARKEAKARLFSWFFSNRLDKSLELVYNREAAAKKYLKDGDVVNPYGRRIPLADRKNALSYLLQSTVADLTHEKAYALSHLLRHKRSFVAFTMHDSVIIDIAEEDIGMMDELKEEFAKTRFGYYLANVSIGTNFGSMIKK